MIDQPPDRRERTARRRLAPALTTALAVVVLTGAGCLGDRYERDVPAAQLDGKGAAAAPADRDDATTLPRRGATTLPNRATTLPRRGATTLPDRSGATTLPSRSGGTTLPERGK
jgi:hypothetical protein